MVLSNKFKEISVEVICFLYILLFVYAAVNKLLDFENFQVQLAQSPLLSAFAGPISYIVLVVEVVIALMLSFQGSKKTGLYAGFSLMVMFTGYIVIMLNFSPFVPCSCGGILEDMSWTEHLVFNMIFVMLGYFGIVLSPNKKSSLFRQYKNGKTVDALSLLLVGFLIMGLLFILSEDMMHSRNNFTRRFPQHPALKGAEIDLGRADYYLAGADERNIYLGNAKSATTIITISKDLTTKDLHIITVPDPEREFSSLTVVIDSPLFFLYDGTKSFIYSGSIKDWKAKMWSIDQAYFNFFQPIDSTRAAIRAVGGQNNEVLLGILNKNQSPSVILNEGILTRQIDGVFDCDGFLLYNGKYHKIIYLYTYRNQFIITDENLENAVTGNTIDTTTKAKIDVRFVSSLQASKLVSPSRVVNRIAKTFDKYLYVNSNLIGQFEDREMWKQASIIDVYDISTQKYVLSFYLYNREGAKMRDFIVTNDRIYVLVDNYIVSYSLMKSTFLKNTQP